MSEFTFEKLTDAEATKVANAFGIYSWMNRTDLNSLWNRFHASWTFERDGSEVSARPPDPKPR